MAEVVPIRNEPTQDVLFVPNREELAWAAGFFDGEGYVQSRVSKARSSFTIQIAQIDRRPLDRFHAAVGVGVVYGPYIPKNPKYKPQWSYHTNRWEHTQAVIAMLWAFLSPPKRAQASAALRQFHERPMWPKDYCKQGHDMGVFRKRRPSGAAYCGECCRLQDFVYPSKIRVREERERVGAERSTHQS